jgi:TPP-dependent pyruvate/acetoin dehydrogenase alpha subunit
MAQKWTVELLKDFETKVAEAFNGGSIKAPVHLSDGNESQMIEVFKSVQAEDWVFCSWRSHYQCLLKGVPEADVYDEILAGRSIALGFPEFKVFSSAIVGGQVPIAVGAALAEKIKGSKSRVWCFLGDMTAEIGISQTSIRYAINHKLPITFVVEDNGLSVMTDTRQTWGTELLNFELIESDHVVFYKYKSKYPHAGAGVRVQF